jgi:hypothetical protein
MNIIMTPELQSIYFNRSIWNKSKSRIWIKSNGFRPMKPAHATTTQIRYRISNPDKYKKFITKNIGDGIYLVFGFI